MRRLVALTLTPLLLGLAPVQEPPPLRYAHGSSCGFVVDPPRTLDEWRERASLVVHVRVESQFSFEDHSHPHFTELATAHNATVLSVIKGHPMAVGEGAVQQILQRGGSRREADHILVEIWNGFDIMPIGSEWLLFLEWNPRLNGFTLFYREYGAIQFEDGFVATETVDRYHGTWKGRPAADLIAAVRQ